MADKKIEDDPMPVGVFNHVGIHSVRRIGQVATSTQTVTVEPQEPIVHRLGGPPNDGVRETSA